MMKRIWCWAFHNKVIAWCPDEKRYRVICATEYWKEHNADDRQ